MKAMQALHDALELRWKKAGAPAHSTELCLWEMTRHLDGLEQQEPPLAVLAEAAELLEDWIAAGEPATAIETEAIRLAKAALPRPA